MDFELQVNAVPGNGDVQLGNIAAVNQHGHNVQVSHGAVAGYDQQHLVTWTYQGRNYDALIRRVAQLAVVSPVKGSAKPKEKKK